MFEAYRLTLAHYAVNEVTGKSSDLITRYVPSKCLTADMVEALSF